MASDPARITEIIQSPERAASLAEQFLRRASRVDVCSDAAGSAEAVESVPIRQCYEELKSRNSKVRWITEITQDNIGQCRELMKFAELRHLDRVTGSFAVSDKEYVASPKIPEGTSQGDLIHSSAPVIIEQNRTTFETLWNAAARASDRIGELENSTPRFLTSAVEDEHEILRRTNAMVQCSARYSVCSVKEGLLYAQKFSLGIFEDAIRRHQSGMHGGVRWVTSIDATDGEIQDVVARFLDLGMEIRHIDSLPPMSFGVSDLEMGMTVERLLQGQLNSAAVFSTEPVIVSHFAAVFEEIWAKAIDARQRLSDLKSKQIAFIDVIRRPAEIEKHYHGLVSAAKEQVLLFLPTTTAYRREQKMGIFDSLVASAGRGVEVKILVPAGDSITFDKYKELMETGRFAIRTIRTARPSEARTKILVVDRTQYLVVELKDDAKETFVEAVGNAILSNSKSTVNSYLTMFDSLWTQAELYEKLNAHDIMQREFINVAAHELRTPTQSILGYSELLQHYPKENTAELVASLTRNAYRLQGLITDILDVARIESGTLRLYREPLDLSELVRSAVSDASGRLANGRVRMEYSESPSGTKPTVYADREKLLQVLSNILGNASKFTKEGKISVRVAADAGMATVTISDTGSGIDPEILPKLFEKFVTKSDRGTGLGLYISKNIITAHGGRIWAENNKQGNGATIAFTLPLADAVPA